MLDINLSSAQQLLIIPLYWLVKNGFTAHGLRIPSSLGASRFSDHFQQPQQVEQDASRHNPQRKKLNF